MKGCKDNILYEYKTNVLGYQTMKVKQIIIRSKMVKYFKGYSKNQTPKEKKRNFYHVFGIFFIFDKLTMPPPSRCFCPKLNYNFFLVLMATPSHLFDKCPKLFYIFFLRASLTVIQRHSETTQHKTHFH